jgi:hypothetical protein
LVLDIAGKVCAIYNGLCADGGKVVTIKCDVEHADWRTRAFQIRDFVSHAFGEWHAAAANSHEKQITRAVIFFDDDRRANARLMRGPSIMRAFSMKSISADTIRKLLV